MNPFDEETALTTILTRTTSYLPLRSHWHFERPNLGKMPGDRPTTRYDSVEDVHYWGFTAEHGICRSLAFDIRVLTTPPLAKCIMSWLKQRYNSYLPVWRLGKPLKKYLLYGANACVRAKPQIGTARAGESCTAHLAVKLNALFLLYLYCNLYCSWIMLELYLSCFLTCVPGNADNSVHYKEYFGEIKNEFAITTTRYCT